MRIVLGYVVIYLNFLKSATNNTLPYAKKTNLKQPGIGKGSHMKTKKKTTRQKKPSIKTIGIVGAGQMGKGIAQVSAQTGFNVIVVEPYAKTIENAKQYINKSLDRSVEIGKINQKKKDKILELLTFSKDLKSLKKADIIIEAAVENRGVKEEIFSYLDKICPPHTIITTNKNSKVTSRPPSNNKSQSATNLS